MFRKFLFLMSFIFFIFLLPSPLSAQGNMYSQPYPVPPYTDNPSVLGQDHAYSVTLRGNGEAVVSAKVVFTNLSESPLNSLSLRVPKVNPNDVIVFQVLHDKQCIRYKPSPVNELQTLEARQATCLEYQDPDYYGYYGNSKYQKAISLMHGDTLDITFPQPIIANASGAFLVYYRAFGYAKKNLFGAYKFTFETLKVEDKIRNLTVGITTDSDLVLKGAKGKVNYRFNETGMMAMKSSEAGVAMASPQFDQYYQQIGYGTITKTASNLQPLDSYSVKGVYAENNLMLYGKEISIAFIVIVFIALLFYLIARKLVVSFGSVPKKDAGANSVNLNLLACLGLGFVVSFVILFYTGGLVVFYTLIRQIIGYDDFLLIVNVLLVIISLTIYAFLFIAPSIYLGIKKGLNWGIGVFASTIVWMMIYLALIFLIIFLTRSRSYPIPYLQNMMNKSGVMRANDVGPIDAVPMMGQGENPSLENTQ